MLSFKNQKPKDKDWKVKKLDSPGPGEYKEYFKGYNLTKETSPKVGFKKGKRLIFAEEAAKNKHFVPDPSKY